MKQYRWRIEFCVATVIAMAGCSSDGPTYPGYYLVNPNSAATGSRSGSAKEFMVAAGCSVLTASPRVGVVRVTTPGGAAEKFDCTGLTRGRVRQALAHYREALAKDRHVTFLVSNQGTYYFAGTYTWCAPPSSTSITNITGYAEDGTPYTADTPVSAGSQSGDCFRWAVWLLDSNGGGPSDNTPVRPAGGGPGAAGQIKITPVTPWTPPPPPPPPSAEIACPISQDTEFTPLDPIFAGEANAPDPVGVDVCKGDGALACLNGHPGVWIGAYKIPITGGLSAHTAILTTPPTQVTELLGPWDYTTNHITPRQDTPAYGSGSGFSAYKWVRVASVSAVPAVNAAIDKATPEFQGLIYSGGSNRFISNVMRYANLTLSEAQHSALGTTPGICTCGICTQ